MGFFKKQVPQEEEVAAVDTTEQHKSLVNIFQDRNILKRKLDEAEAERSVLRADVEDLRKRHDEVQRQLSSVEKMLTDPERAQSAILYYRLRAVWDTCRQQLRALAEELSNRQEQLERERHGELFEQRRAAQLKDLQKLVDILDRDRQNLVMGIADMEKEVARLKRFWHKKKREALQIQIEETREKFLPIDKRKAELAAKIEQTRKAPAQAFGGIGIPARRAINTALLSLAQYLYLHFTEYNIAEMARSAGTKPVSDVNYGPTNDCLAIGASMWEVVMKLKKDTGRPEKLKNRSEYLRQKLSYVNDGESVPEESSLDYMLPFSPNGDSLDLSVNAIPVNVVHLNYWDIQSILLRPSEKAEQAAPSVKTVGTD
ncbi:MAG TPA: hypothetical protein VGO35_05955 [Gammaproteobacteria bacterium]|nr:hypothetical protein [Gammaproteobacteria bacterium]